ncbi:alpha/beta hydrolase [Microbacterium sp. X-17]|uniref:alpha/beta hydrolase n=1 Tax=Microbacterium sp. X-17 TaxID=3144404 RepID=UPI0031F5B245
MDQVESAERLVRVLAAHDFGSARHMFDRRVRRKLSARSLAAAWQMHVDSLGSPAMVGSGELVDATSPARVEVPIAVGSRHLSASVHFNDDGQCTDLQVRPSLVEWTPPDYVDPNSFTEESFELETSTSAVGATLTRPRPAGPVPLVILLMGGGPFDRDGTAGPNRIGRDLAGGLSSAGFAVLRFDKPSFRNPALRGRPTFAPSQDYIPPVAAAVNRFAGHREFNSAWLLGHSMGGRYAPRVAAAVTGIDGLVLMAADAAPMHHSAVRVARHLAALPGADNTASALTTQLEKAATQVDSPRLSLRTAPSKLPFGFTAGTWLELRNDDPVTTAANLDIPVLLLQGGRDYQVTEADDLALWRQGLTTGATIRVLPDDDHYFFPGTGKSTPASYDQAQHVDHTAISTVTEFIRHESPTPSDNPA